MGEDDIDPKDNILHGLAASGRSWYSVFGSRGEDFHLAETSSRGMGALAVGICHCVVFDHPSIVSPVGWLVVTWNDIRLSFWILEGVRCIALF
jgi:hypothetical protein